MTSDHHWLLNHRRLGLNPTTTARITQQSRGSLRALLWRSASMKLPTGSTTAALTRFCLRWLLTLIGCAVLVVEVAHIGQDAVSL